MDHNQPRPAAGSAAGVGFKERRALRHVVDEVALLSPQRRIKIEVRLRNVSTLGFMAECDEAVRIGSYVSLDVPGIGPVKAQVRWQIGPRLGGMFLDPISLECCEWAAVGAGTPFSQ